MGPEMRRTDSSLTQLLFQEGYRFNFFQAVRLLERLNPDRVPIGADGPPSREVVRLRVRQSLAFPASAIHDLRPSATTDLPPDMIVSFMGLTGPSGVLPAHYTELLIDRAAAKDEALREFLDLFNHRLLSLFYAAWHKHHVPVAYERAALQGGTDRFTRQILALIGLGLQGLQHRMGLNDQSLLFYAGALHQRPHSASCLEGIIGSYCGVPTEVRQFQGQWLRLRPEDATYLGQTAHRLGSEAMLGTTVWDQQAAFRLRIGPLNWSQFRRFLPGGDGLGAAMQLTEFFSGPEMEFDCQLLLEKAEVPDCRLTSTDPFRLGWSSWLKSTPFKGHADQVVLSKGAMPAMAAA
jgi:type VI secretion system protein ImpH